MEKTLTYIKKGEDLKKKQNFLIFTALVAWNHHTPTPWKLGA